MIPALFPFAVLSRFLLLSGLLPKKGKIGALAGLFGLPGTALPALVAGLFCGFPMGAFAAAELSQEGLLNEKEAFRAAAFSNNAGAAFLFGTAAALFGSFRAGLTLFLAQTAASVAVGLYLGRRAKKEVRENFSRFEKVSRKKSDTLFAESSEQPPPLLPLMADSIVKGGTAMLSVASFVVFFSVITAAIGEIALFSPALPFLSALLEAGSALKNAALLAPVWGYRPALLLAAFAAGWSGLSVFLQAEALFGGRLPLSYLAAVRLAVALLTVLFSLLLSFLLPV